MWRSEHLTLLALAGLVVADRRCRSVGDLVFLCGCALLGGVVDLAEGLPVVFEFAELTGPPDHR